MTYSKAATGLQRVAVARLPRIDSRISFLSLDRCKVVQGRTGVLAVLEDGNEVPVPGGSLVVLMLGPGVSITTRAWRTLANSGCVVMASTAAGDGCFTSATPLTSSGKWACSQARMWADENARMQGARMLYRQRFPDDLPEDLSIAQLRGLEGKRMRAVYRERAAEAGLPNWRRRVDEGENTANGCLNLANSLLYGLAAAVCSAFGLSPALGLIHQGASNAFLFDLADCYKTTVSIPAAFESCRQPDAGEATRRAVRSSFKRQRVLASMVKLVTELLEPHLAATGDLDVLYGGSEEWVPGHRNYARETPISPEVAALSESGEEPF